jgi:hypothetical protein
LGAEDGSGQKGGDLPGGFVQCGISVVHERLPFGAPPMTISVQRSRRRLVGAGLLATMNAGMGDLWASEIPGVMLAILARVEGVVHRATDIKLNRHVAIKLLPQQLANDSERMLSASRSH